MEASKVGSTTPTTLFAPKLPFPSPMRRTSPGFMLLRQMPRETSETSPIACFKTIRVRLSLNKINSEYSESAQKSSVKILIFQILGGLNLPVGPASWGSAAIERAEQEEEQSNLGAQLLKQLVVAQA